MTLVHPRYQCRDVEPSVIPQCIILHENATCCVPDKPPKKNPPNFISVSYNQDNTTSPPAPASPPHNSNETTHTDTSHYHKRPYSHNSRSDKYNTSYHPHPPHPPHPPSPHPHHSHPPPHYPLHPSRQEYQIFYSPHHHRGGVWCSFSW